MKRYCRFIIAMVTLIVLSLSNGSAFADSINDEEFAKRIDFIQTRLDEGTTNAKRWQYSWMFINGGISYLQLGMATTQTDNDEENDRYDNIVGGVSGLVATGDLIFNPLNSWNAAGKL